MLLEDTDDNSMYNLTGPLIKPLVMSVKLNSVDLEMELDIGASISVAVNPHTTDFGQKEKHMLYRSPKLR